jgi:hypothetical protein
VVESVNFAGLSLESVPNRAKLRIADMKMGCLVLVVWRRALLAGNDSIESHRGAAAPSTRAANTA